jgi:hypothetical protein
VECVKDESVSNAPFMEAQSKQEYERLENATSADEI